MFFFTQKLVFTVSNILYTLSGFRGEEQILWSGQRVKLAYFSRLLSLETHYLIVYISLQAVLLFLISFPCVFQTPLHSLPSLGIC